MRYAGRRPNDLPWAGLLFDIIYSENSYSFEHQVKLVLVGVVVNGLLLPRLQAVQPDHQEIAAEERGLVELLLADADMIAIVSDVGFHVILLVWVRA